MPKHTPEPWMLHRDNHMGLTYPMGEEVSHRIIWGDGRDVAYLPPHSDGDNGNANAARIVACVNACKGLNPDAIPELLEAAKTLLDNRVPIPDKGADYAVRSHVAALREACNGVEGAA